MVELTNNWLSRTKAAPRLRGQVQDLRSQGWKVHLVGHSHGGNVSIEAITDDVDRLEPWFMGRVAQLFGALRQVSGRTDKYLKLLRGSLFVVSQSKHERSSQSLLERFSRPERQPK